nr:PREDICTED: uncharacterized protein LOC105672698 [Linepithema humile]
MSSPRPRTEMCYYMKIIVIGMLMVTLCYPIFIEAAAIPSEQFSEQLQRMALQDIKNIRISRSLEDNEENVRNCYNGPCGWAVYHKHTRNVEYFMKNACECADETYKCVRSGDDLSASAYVYRCRQNSTSDDVLPLEDTN